MGAKGSPKRQREKEPLTSGLMMKNKRAILERNITYLFLYPLGLVHTLDFNKLKGRLDSVLRTEYFQYSVCYLCYQGMLDHAVYFNSKHS